MKIYNTLSRKKENFKPRKGKQVQLFVCGPTVYDLSHIGHARTYLAFDFIVNYWKYRGYTVNYLQNITDVDDKIIKRAHERKKQALAFAEEYYKEYLADMKLIGITSVNKYALATKYVRQIISQVDRLMKKGYAYTIEGDGIYYDVSKFKDYGKLAHRTVLEAEDAVTRIDTSIKKRNKADFALWKFRKQPYEPAWKASWGNGRPGWHIEDTAITEKEFGPQYDAHGGARDLMFPHHEAEIAQIEAVSGKKPFVKYWMHTGFLTVDGTKMSKSIGNVILIRDAVKKYGVETLRFLFVSTHYRSPMDFSEKAVEQARSNLLTLYSAKEKLEKTKGKETTSLVKKAQGFKNQFIKVMDDDLNTPKAVAVLLEFSKFIHKNKAGKKTLKILIELACIFGVLQKNISKVPKEVKDQLAARNIARKKKNWKKSDKIRADLKEKGWQVQDTETGSVARKLAV